MSLQIDAVPLALAAAGWLIFVPALLAALRAPQRVFPRSDAVEHAWLGGAVLVSILWMLQIRLGGSPVLGILGSGLLLAWSEAIISGMLLSSLVVFRPQIVLTFREELYNA